MERLQQEAVSESGAPLAYLHLPAPGQGTKEVLDPEAILTSSDSPFVHVTMAISLLFQGQAFNKDGSSSSLL